MANTGRKSVTGNIKMGGFDALFGETKAVAGEQVIKVPLEDLHDFKDLEALNDILEDLKEDSSGNGARGNISDRDRLIPVDYEGLTEKVEDAERIAREKAVSQPSRPSLKARLTEKKAEAAQPSREQEKHKENRQMEIN